MQIIAPIKQLSFQYGRSCNNSYETEANVLSKYLNNSIDLYIFLSLIVHVLLFTYIDYADKEEKCHCIMTAFFKDDRDMLVQICK